MQSSVFVVFVHFLFQGTFWWRGSLFIFRRDIPNSGTPRLKSSHYPLQQALVIRRRRGIVISSPATLNLI